MLAQKVRLELLFDFYGSLLTERQREVLSLHWDDDCSLGEIAESLGVSRQAVYYTVKSGERALENYEKKLHLVAQSEEQRSKLSSLVHRLDSVAACLSDPEARREVRCIRESLHRLAES